MAIPVPATFPDERILSAIDSAFRCKGFCGNSAGSCLIEFFGGGIFDGSIIDMLLIQVARTIGERQFMFIQLAVSLLLLLDASLISLDSVFQFS